MSSKALALLLSLPLGLALTACGDDGGGGGDDSETDPGTTTMDTPTSAGPTTNTPTTDEPTTDEPTTEDTIDPDTTAGETDDTAGETEDDTDDTTVVEPMPAYYRVNSLNLRDPHVFVAPVGDQTDTVNGQLTAALSEDSPDDKKAQDGQLDLGFVLGFLPLDQSDAASESMFFTNAACTAPVDSTTCDVLPPLAVEMSTYTSAEAGECYAPTPANLSDYAGGPAAPEPTAGPCFSASFAAVTILAGGFELPMTDVSLAATYVGNPAGNLVAGNIEGFISTTDAEATIVPTPLGDRTLAELLQAEDQDGDGWIFHLAYTAVPVDWTGA